MTELSLEAENALLRARVADLEAKINSPVIEDFLKGVANEMAHQRELWCEEHDAGKSVSDWIKVAVYLLGKATSADWEGDADKLLHHIITTAAVMGYFHEAVKKHRHLYKGDEDATQPD